MRNYRRFKLHKGNKEKFWEIRRYDKTLYFREGNIKRKTGEKAPTTTPDEKKDFRQAQLAYDKEIQRKLALGYVEVDEASTPTEEVFFQAIRLVSLDGAHTLNLNEAESTKILNFMVDKLVFNKRAKVLNIGRWERRALHGSDYQSLADIDSLSEDYCTYLDKWLALSKRDRAYNEEDVIPLFKYTDPQYWIVTESECQQIIQSIQSELTKRRSVLDESDKKSSPYFRLKEAWLEFHLAAKASGGYQVFPCSLQFHSTKHGHSFFMDARNWNDVFNTLLSLDIWDRTEPTYAQNDFASVEDHLQMELIPSGNAEDAPIPPDSADQENLVSQLLLIEEAVNEAHQGLSKSKKNILDGGLKWNATNVKSLIKALESMEDELFETNLADYYEEELTAHAELQCEDGNIDLDTQRVINEILNDACHLLNRAHQNIHNTDGDLFPIAEDQTRDVFDLDILEDVIGALQHLFPEVLNYEVTSEEQILKDYTYRPSGLDEELMESWVHLLPDSIDCLELLEGYLEFIQVEDALVEQYPTAKDFCLKYLRMAQTAMVFRSQLASARRKTLRAESNTMGQVLLYKITDLSEPWILTPTELSIIIEAVYQAEEKNPVLLSLMKFFNTAADSEGCTLLDANNN